MAEKTEQPTDKKRRDARRDGQVAHSQDVGQLLGFAVALLFFWVAGERLLAILARLLLAPARLPRDAAFDQQLGLVAQQVGVEAALALAPLLGAMVVGGVAADLLQNGPLFTPKRIAPSFGKLNVWSNVKTRFALPAWVDLLKTMAKTGLLLAVAGIVLRAGFADIMRLGGAPALAAWRLLGDLLRSLGLFALALLIPLALLDIYWQRAQLTRKLKMSIDEVRREYKQTEGAPEIKGERRRRHQELSTEEIRSRVKRSSVVVVNPVHFAVGLRYVAGVTPLPVVTFKDFGTAVPGIRRIARRYGVPVIRYPALARRLYAQAAVDRHIPAASIEAVAHILSMALRGAPFDGDAAVAPVTPPSRPGAAVAAEDGR